MNTLLQIVKAAQVVITDNLQPDGIGDHAALATLAGLLDCATQREAEAQAARDATDAELWRFLLSTVDPTSESFKIMEALAENHPLIDDETPNARVFEAHVRAGLAELKRRFPS